MEHTLTLAHGESPWTAALISVDGMIVASSMTLLADSGAGRSGGLLPWLLLVVGSGASLAANVAVAEPTAYGRVIAAWPSFALIGAYELLIRQRPTAASGSPSGAAPRIERVREREDRRAEWTGESRPARCGRRDRGDAPGGVLAVVARAAGGRMVSVRTADCLGWLGDGYDPAAFDRDAVNTAPARVRLRTR